MSASCNHNHDHAHHGHSHDIVFDGKDVRFRRVLIFVIAINFSMFLAEMVAGALADSQALRADALDFLADSITYGISLWAIGMSPRIRAQAAIAKGISLSVMGVWVLGLAIYHAIFASTPQAMTIGVIGMVAFAANLLSVLLLYRWRNGDSNIRSVWLCSRSDAIGNLAVVAAAIGVFGTGTRWPDLIVAAIMAGLFLNSSILILRQALREIRVRTH